MQQQSHGTRNGSNKEGEGWEAKTSGKSQSSWFVEAGTLKFQKLDRDISVDVVIVGGGIAGITAAYLLSKAGKKVAVIDDGNLGSGETGRTTAHITHALDDRYYKIENQHGREGAKLAAQSHTAAIDLIESIVRSDGIDCHFERLNGYLFLDPTDKRESLDDELEATRRAGIMTEIVNRSPLQSFDIGPCIQFPNQAQFQPLKYLAGLARAIVQSGSFVFTLTHAQDVTSLGVKTADGRRARAKKAVVVATNAPIIDKISKIYDKQDAYRTYVIAAKIDKGAIPKALYWDTGDQQSEYAVKPYHYVRIQELKHDRKYDLLVVGGEDHPTGNADDMENRYRRLESWTRQRFPIHDIEYRWSGQVLEPKDSMAFIGRNPKDKRKNIFIATGDSGNGITHGTVAGILLTDLILGRKNPWARLYNPSRAIKKKEENNDSGGNEDNSSNKLDIDEALLKTRGLQPGQSMVLEIKGKKDARAFYKAEGGRVHSFSAACTHLGCTVKWNKFEKSFDCPCHGSRFSYGGRVINGPANDNLKEIDL